MLSPGSLQVVGCRLLGSGYASSSCRFVELSDRAIGEPATKHVRICSDQLSFQGFGSRLYLLGVVFVYVVALSSSAVEFMLGFGYGLSEPGPLAESNSSVH